VSDLDAIIACEILCYLPDADAALREMATRLRPGGALLVSVEARWGWAAAYDAPAGSCDEALDGRGVIDLPGERWVCTYSREDLEGLIRRSGLQALSIFPLHYVFEGPLQYTVRRDMEIGELIAIEDRCRVHPVWGPLNRVWAAVGIRPSGL